MKATSARKMQTSHTAPGAALVPARGRAALHTIPATGCSAKRETHAAARWRAQVPTWPESSAATTCPPSPTYTEAQEQQAWYAKEADVTTPHLQNGLWSKLGRAARADGAKAPMQGNAELRLRPVGVEQAAVALRSSP
eukprot:CAMPEP_0175230172 /NCGR_PEP_ID=MMETSP0093-20121207/24810_1 /TAXON_ID=311494 /ORGANISM="Alexandrium monilatum, Strain CCMP3105" /LENGTH=137 /DNA_ID=CAMNT_0016523997 /DNA_START=89 /DNA_END=503 /DNA_ORIENTATION=-